MLDNRVTVHLNCFSNILLLFIVLLFQEGVHTKKESDEKMKDNTFITKF